MLASFLKKVVIEKNKNLQKEVFKAGEQLRLFSFKNFCGRMDR